MDDFFKQFRENLDARPAPSFEEKDWRKLSNRLDRQSGKRPLPVVWWWVALPLALLLMGANVLFFSELKDARQKIAALEIRQDTVWLTKVEYRTDTVYQTRIVRQTVVEYLPAAPRLKSWAGQYSGESLTHHDFNRGNGDSLTHDFNRGDANRGDGDSQSHDFNRGDANRGDANRGDGEPPTHDFNRGEADENLILLNTPATKPFRIRWAKPRMHDFPLPEKQEEWDEKLLKTLYAMRPKGLQAGVHAGWSLPLLAELQQPGGVSVGLHAAIVFSPQLQLWADGDYFKLHYETDRMGDDLGIPAYSPPNAEYVLSSAEVTQRSMQVALGMQYFFNPKGNWRPFIGAGYGAVRTLPYDIFYDFEHPVDPNLLPFLLEMEVPRKETLSGFVLLRAGVERRITKNWNWRLMASWRNSWEENQFPASRLLGLQTGVTVGF